MKKVLVTAVILLLILVGVGGYVLLDHMFPVAAPVICPNENDIVSLSMTQNSDFSTSIEISDFGIIMQNIRNAQPTRIWSINDYPTLETYYTIQIDTSARQYRYYIYAENSQVYLEHPYNGVYRTNRQFLDSITDYFRS